MRRLLLVCVVVIGCASSRGDEGLAPGVAAMVDGERVSAAELQDELRRMAGDVTKLPPERARELSNDVLERMIDDRLCAKALATLGAPVTEAELDAELARRGAQAASPDLGPGVIRGALRNMLCRRRLVERRGHVNVTEADVEAELRKLPAGATDEARARQAAVLRGQRWQAEEQRILRELRAHATIRIARS